MSTEEQLFNALTGTVTAAEAAAQACVAIWSHLSSEQQDRWLAQAERMWPRADIYLKTLLPAAEKIIADEHEVF